MWESDFGSRFVVVRASLVRMLMIMMSFLLYLVCLMWLSVCWSSYVACFCML